MSVFSVTDYPSGLSGLLTNDSEAELGAGDENGAVERALADLDLPAAFAPHQIIDTDMAAACHCGLWLLHGYLDQSHAISQNIDDATGSFWHGVMHRREGDYSNAKYWFRRVDDHSIFEPLATAANRVAADLFVADAWDPFRFVDLCEAATRRDTRDAVALRRVARCEWELLFDYCFRCAIGNA